MTEGAGSTPDADGLVEYWRALHARREQVPDEQIVCHPGAPDWLNAYVASAQRRAMKRALEHVPSLRGKKILDLGCGTGRWSAYLHALGGNVLGVDVSEDAIEQNRRRYRGIRFSTANIDQLDLGESFDVVVTVTVLQHLPASRQTSALGRINSHLRHGGWVVALENIKDVGRHVFARPIDEWQSGFEEAGLRRVWAAGYEYSLPIRAVQQLAGWWPRADGPASAPSQSTARERGLATTLYRTMALHPAVWLSTGSDPLLERYAPAKWASHAAMVFRRPDHG